MSGFPKIKGLRWVNDDFPDLVALEVTLVDRSLQEMAIEGMALPEQPGVVYIDLSKLASVTPWYPKGSDDPSPIACAVEVEGVDRFIANISVKDLLEAWIFYKRFKRAHDTRNI